MALDITGARLSPKMCDGGIVIGTREDERPNVLVPPSRPARLGERIPRDCRRKDRDPHTERPAPRLSTFAAQDRGSSVTILLRKRVPEFRPESAIGTRELWLPILLCPRCLNLADDLYEIAPVDQYAYLLARFLGAILDA
jgi:hypothetical protein